MESCDKREKGENMQNKKMEEIPIGFALSLAMNKAALDAYTEMGEAQRDAVIARSRQTQTKEEMEHLVEQLGQEKYF